MKALGLATLVLLSTPAAHARRSVLPGAGLVSESTARALNAGAPVIDSIRGEIYKQKGLVEARTQEEILRHAGFRELRGFYIDYSTLQCVSTPRLDGTKVLGSCVAKAHAFQVTADVAVNVTAAGITVHALNTIVD